MIKILLSTFKKEKKGAPIIEYVLILCLTGLLAAAVLTPMRNGITDIFSNLIDGLNDDEEAAEETNGSLPNYDEMIGISIQMTPSSNVTKSTPVSFSASVSGGEGPYQFEWTGYNGNSDGSSGPEQFYNTDSTVSVKVTDNTGNWQTVSKSFTIAAVPATLTVSDETPIVGETVVATLEISEGVTCQFLSPVASDNCAVSVPIPNDSLIDVVAEVCQEGTCETLKKLITPRYEVLTLESVVGDYPQPEMYQTDFAKFKAVAKGGSGNIKVEWDNYNGPTEPNIPGEQQQYSVGQNIVKARVCEVDNPTDCTDWVGHTFEVKPTVSESMPLMTWLTEPEIYTVPYLMTSLIGPEDIGCIGQIGNCVFGQITLIDGNDPDGTAQDPRSDQNRYPNPPNGFAAYTYNVEICDDTTCNDNELTVYVETPQ